MFGQILTLLYPPSCYVCGQALLQGEKYLCSPCCLSLPICLDAPEKSNWLMDKQGLGGPGFPMYCFLEFRPQGPAQVLMHAVKYQGAYDLGVWLGEWGARYSLQQGLQASVDVILPLPLHPQRMRERGYNQAQAYASGMLKVWKCQAAPAGLHRARPETSLVGLDKAQRWERMQGVFEWRAGTALQGARVLLLDDTITTGATLLSAAHCLMQEAQPAALVLWAMAGLK